MTKAFTQLLFLARQCEQHQLTRCAQARTYSSSPDNLRTLIPSQHSYPRVAKQCFSTSPRWHAQSSAKDTKKSSKSASQEKMMEEYRRAAKAGALPEEVGLIPDTFIMPTGKNLPSWTSNRKQRWMVEKKRLKARMTELGATLYYKYWHVRPKPRLNKSEIPAVAENLHKQMYEHFGSGNLAPLESQIFPGLMGSLRGRIAQRPSGTQLKWTLHKYLSKTKLVQYVPAMFPGAKTEKPTERRGVIQAVVRIHSLQSLQHIRRRSLSKGAGTVGRTIEVLVDPQGRESKSQDPALAEKHAKELVEYIVLQKTVRNSRDGPWKLWGTAEETTVEKLEAQTRKRRAPRGEPAAA